VTERSYHHGSLRQAVIDAAVAEVQAVGAAAVSMREIARRAGVSHAAPAHHFGDKPGIFTAIATEGFRAMNESVGAATRGPDGFMQGGVAYVAFALEHPGHFEVMFRPDLHRRNDPELVDAREQAFAILHGSAAQALAGATDDDVLGLVIAGWSVSHGLATLWLTANLEERVAPAPERLAEQMRNGLIRLGRLAGATEEPSN
jgi:AcrR family transcriptional regulator